MIDGAVNEKLDLGRAIMEFKAIVEVTRGVDDIVETTEEVIKYYNPKGLSATHPWFDFNGVHVCLSGTRDTVEKILTLTREEKMHGKP